MKAKLTPWFATSTKPVHAGVYRTRIPHIDGNTPGFSKWDGNQWGNERRSIELAECDPDRGYQSKEWRGLASDPSKEPK
jgi:hypothetical protein